MLAAAGALAALGVAAAPAHAGAAPPPKLTVVGTDFAFKPARPVVRAGPRIIVLVNRGEVRHNLTLRRLNSRGRPTGKPVLIANVQAGKRAQKQLRLAAGRYTMVCTIGDHASLGMVGRLTVRAAG
jgi:plastocyanin